MSEPEQVEQITKVPNAPPPRVKDPKKVAAGKALQVRNREAKEELLRYRAQEAERNKQMKQENEEYKAAEEERIQVENSSPYDGFFSRISFSDILSLVGVGLTAYALFFKKEVKKKAEWEEPVEMVVQTSQPKAKKDRPKFGM